MHGHEEAYSSRHAELTHFYLDSKSIRATGQLAEDFGNSITRGSVGMMKDADRRGRGQPTRGLSELDRGRSKKQPAPRQFLVLTEH